MAQALASAPLDAPVPTCPEWTGRDLAVHAGNFSGFWAHVLCEGTGRPKPEVPDPPQVDVPGWFSDVTSHLGRVLAETDPTTEVWTWSLDDHSAAFVARRAAHELAVHRVDAELTAGHQNPVEADLAADGIDEIMMIIDHRQRTDADGLGEGWGEGQRLHLHAADTGHDWLLVLDPAGLQVERAAGPAQLRIDASASDLEMLLYRRPTLGAVERSGDEAALDAWFRLFRFT